MTRNAILFHLGDDPNTPGGLGVFFGKLRGTECRVKCKSILEPTVICPAVHVMSNASIYRTGKRIVCLNLAPLDPVAEFEQSNGRSPTLICITVEN